MFFGEWNGSSYEEAPGGLHVTYDNGLLTIMFDQSECNLSPTFVFWVTSFRGPDPNNPVTDDAPDGNDVFTYGMSTVAPAAKTSAVVTSGAPRSGRSFMVTGLGVLFADGTSRNMVGLNCTATLAGKRLRGSGTGGCLFALPKKAKHEKLVVRVSGEAANGAAYRKTVSYVVR